MIGVGFLTLPTIGKNNGWVGIIIFIFVAQITSMIGNLWLVRAYRATEGRCKCYPTIVEEILGVKQSALIIVFMMLYILASSTSYYLFAYTFAKSLVFDKFDWLGKDSETLFKWAFVFTIFGIQFLGCLPKKISALSYFTAVSATIIFYVSMVIVADFFINYQDYKNKGAHVIAFEFNASLCGSYGLALFSAVNQFAVCNIVGELNMPSTRRLKKTIVRSYIFPIFIYLVVGVVGYITYGS